MPENHIVVLSTAPDQKSAENIAAALVEQRLAACVNLLPGVTSIYRWKDEVKREPECLLLIKTSADRFEALRQRLRELHPYELPEIIALAIGAGDPDYLAWLTESTRPR
ncbi:MAG: divalent-cation tolerance protein CutA [Gammaproteobacteria bacterium]|nr:divalent-cation tolerance protein CutA [Gammaproteobacteria bacterium]MBU6509800.1 divalent-cation tolerance protein CutA [Gammaproteobacteria bacterium]MDE1983256.1 divalent-cation tolerance protein CutA [Gammaproteobacteria bacterium]MDE2109283.1 divalent-cation tolerance protein CutA [Gammaproteobacteria bacterium]MDE2461138.1 divalent-cation tolerance protein CutA [Gammaproteobacteria bacterium]